MEYLSALKSRSRPARPRRSKSKPSEIYVEPALLPRSLKSPGRPLPLFAKLDAYQKGAVQFAAARSGCALFFEQGTGKTWIALGLIEYLDVDTAMLVVPLTNLVTTWEKTIRAELPAYTICKSWTDFKKCKDKKRILLVHYEGLPKFVARMQKFEFELVVFDESQRLKSRSSRASRLARRFRRHQRRVILSGTPMDKSPIDVWAQLRFCDYKVFGDNWSKDPDDFGNHFCYKGGFMGKQFIFRTGSGKKGFRRSKRDPIVYDDTNMMPEYLERLKTVALRVEKADVLDTHAPKEIQVPVIMLGEQRRLYERMDQKGVIRIEGTRIMCDLEITKRMKLQQMTGGFIFDEEGEIISIGKAKERALNNLILKIKRDFDSPVVIFCQFTEEIAIIRRVLEKHYKRIGALHGKIKDTKRDPKRTRIQNDFQSGKLDALILQVKTGGVGIDLFYGHVGIFYSFSHSWIDFDQAKARLDRRGQKNRVYIFLMIAQDTIDEDKLEAIRSKCSLTQAVLKRLKQRRP